MARLTPDELEALKKKDEELYDPQFPSEKDDPVDLDENYKDTMGNDLSDDEDLDIVEEVEEDEGAIQEKEINNYEDDSEEDLLEE